MRVNLLLTMNEIKVMIMDIFEAVMICEGAIDVDSEEEMVSAWQRIIDDGLVWSLQGWFGRTAQGLIDSGVCNQRLKIS
jgi:hypothetical protein